jgi:hypothetical protein
MERLKLVLGAAVYSQIGLFTSTHTGLTHFSTFSGRGEGDKSGERENTGNSLKMKEGEKVDQPIT